LLQELNDITVGTAAEGHLALADQTTGHAAGQAADHAADQVTNYAPADLVTDHAPDQAANHAAAKVAAKRVKKQRQKAKKQQAQQQPIQSVQQNRASACNVSFSAPQESEHSPPRAHAPPIAASAATAVLTAEQIQNRCLTPQALIQHPLAHGPTAAIPSPLAQQTDVKPSRQEHALKQPPQGEELAAPETGSSCEHLSQGVCQHKEKSSVHSLSPSHCQSNSIAGPLVHAPGQPIDSPETPGMHEASVVSYSPESAVGSLARTPALLCCPITSVRSWSLCCLLPAHLCVLSHTS